MKQVINKAKGQLNFPGYDNGTEDCVNHLFSDEFGGTQGKMMFVASFSVG